MSALPRLGSVTVRRAQLRLGERDRILRAVVDSELRCLLPTSGYLPTPLLRCHAHLVDLEEIGGKHHASVVALAFLLIDVDSHTSESSPGSWVAKVNQQLLSDVSSGPEASGRALDVARTKERAGGPPVPQESVAGLMGM